MREKFGSNMSYCIFENTYKDLLDCEDALENKGFDELSETEKKYYAKLIALCQKIGNVLQSN